MQPTLMNSTKWDRKLAKVLALAGGRPASPELFRSAKLDGGSWLRWNSASGDAEASFPPWIACQQAAAADIVKAANSAW